MPDDLNILESLLNDTGRAAKVLEKAAGKIRLKINNEKTKIMKLHENEDDTEENDEYVTFERVNKNQYLGVMLSVKNDWSREISHCLCHTKINL